MTTEIGVVVHRHTRTAIHPYRRRLAVQALKSGDRVTKPEALFDALVLNVFVEANLILLATLSLSPKLWGCT